MAKTMTSAKLSPMQKHLGISREEKRKSMFLYVARELTGRSIHRDLKAKKKQLDWEKFNESFNSYYADYSADEILDEILSNVYWLANEQAVIDLYFRYLDDAQRNANGNGSKAEEDELEFAK